MSRTLLVLLAVILTTGLLSTVGCAQTGHATRPSTLGTAPRWEAVLASLDTPGPITFEAIDTANWEVPRSGLLNLDHPTAEAAGLEDGPEAIQIFMYALRHPTRGLFLVDTGVDSATAARDTDAMAASWLIRSAMNLEALEVHVDTRSWLAAQAEPLAGVLLTHLHLDHAMGLPDIPAEVPVYVGPGETGDSKFMNLFTRGTTNRMLEGRPPLETLAPQPVDGAPFVGVLDLFGDGSVYGLHVPGHTAGSMAYLVRTTEGPVLLTGDGSHTAWGWVHGVESGTYNTDPEGARESFVRLRDFVRAHPSVEVHLGHQALAPGSPVRFVERR